MARRVLCRSLFQSAIKRNREFPEHPRPAVGVAVFRKMDARFLVVQRGKEPRKGSWSLPGGAIRLGEPIECAARREVKEETGLDVEIGPTFFSLDGIYPESGRIKYHYVVVDVLGLASDDAVPQACSDAMDVKWVSECELEAMESAGTILTPQLRPAVHRARQVFDQCDQFNND